jgi:predicted SPOUT superfamily RNA methylase MTH1
MKIRRGLFDKHKQNMWIINIGIDKYIWIKKPKYIINKIGKILLRLVALSFMILYIIGLELLDLVKENGLCYMGMD